ncbi:hypothetical protein ACWGOQ_0008030 [Aquimarina sp. M1]
MITQTTSKQSENHQTYSLRLSRMKNELSALLTKLHSYRYEPCTTEMHKEFLELDESGHRLKHAIIKILEVLKGSVRFSKEIGEETFGVMKKYHTFQKNISTYMSEAIIHH